MDAQIGQMEKTQEAFIVYKNVLFMRGGVRKLNLRLRSGLAESDKSCVCKLLI